jgi:hypothetical protein
MNFYELTNDEVAIAKQRLVVALSEINHTLATIDETKRISPELWRLRISAQADAVPDPGDVTEQQQ